MFGKPLFVRGDLGVELRIGNNLQAEGWGVLTYHPGSNRFLNEQYKQMGEAAYDDEQADLAKEWIAQHPKLFLTLSFRRFIFFWAGIPRERAGAGQKVALSGILAAGNQGITLAAKRRIHGVFLFATLLGFYPLIYYFTFVLSRYRHAIDPELVILAIFSLNNTVRHLPSRFAP